jgi:hypothetical protein
LSQHAFDVTVEDGRAQVILGMAMAPAVGGNAGGSLKLGRHRGVASVLAMTVLRSSAGCARGRNGRPVWVQRYLPALRGYCWQCGHTKRSSSKHGADLGFAAA